MGSAGEFLGSRFGATWSILGPIVTSGRSPTPLDAGRGGNHLLARYSQNLAESGGEESLILQNKPIGTERVPKGHQKGATGRPKYIKKIGLEKGERNKRERRGMGGALGFWSTFGGTWSILGFQLWRH